MKLIGDYKKVLIVTATAVVSAAVGAIAYHPAIVHGDFDLTGLNQQVQNHEARLTNTEHDVKDLQANTDTAPAANPLPVPVVTAQPVEASPAVAPVAEPVPTPVSQPEATTQPYILGYWCGGSDNSGGYVDAHWSDGRIDYHVKDPRNNGTGTLVCISN